MKAQPRTTWRLLRPYALPHAPRFALLFALGAISALGQRAVLLLLEPTLLILFPGEGPPDAAAEPERSAGFLGGLRESFRGWFLGAGEADPDRFALLLRVGAAIALVAAVAAAAQFGFIMLYRWVALRMVVDLRVDIARHLMGLSMHYHGRRHFGDLLSRISSDVTTTLSVVNEVLKDLIQDPLMVLASLLLAAWIAPMPTLLIVIGLPILAIPVAVFSRRIRKGSTRSLTSLGASVQALTQMFQGIRTVKSFRAEERELERYRSINEGYVRDTMKMARALALSQSWSILFSHVGLAVLLLVIGFLTLSRADFRGVGEMATFFLLVATTYSNIKGITKTVARVQEGVGASQRLLDLLEERPDVVERAGARPVRGLGAGVRFEAVDFAYPDGEGLALREIDLELRAGETLALVGPSGAGKSTVMDLVARFVDPTAGRVTVDGVDLREVSLESWTDTYAMVGQVPFLFHTSIEENIRYGRPDASRAEVEEAARMAGIHDFVHTLPEGYDTNVADAGQRLSGGQRQRITIARAFLKGAPLLLLDEATSALDTESEKVVQEALERLMADRTVLVIAHRLSTIRHANRIAVLEHGRLVELGTHDELLLRDGPYARLYAVQLEAAAES